MNDDRSTGVSTQLQRIKRVDQIVEVAIPLECLKVRVDQPIQFFIELLQGGQSRDRAPREGTINLTCPSPDFEQIMWDV